MRSVAVIGAGAWGTSIAAMLARKGLSVSLWMYEEKLAEEAERTRINKVYLPGETLPEGIKVTSDFETAFRRKRTVISVVPTQHIRGIFEKTLPYIREDASFVSASKGIENGTLKRPSEVLQEIFPSGRISVLSGPSFASEVIKKLPTAVTLASSDKQEARRLQELLTSSYFRIYTHEDIIGVELGGALKNVVAIASGISDGLGLGNNARAALITRGLAEMKRLGLAMGANENTFSGLSGMGDLVLTATATLSRNYTFGMKLAQGQKAEQIIAGSKSVAEGVQTSKSVMGLIKKYKIEMPIAHEIYRVIFEGKAPDRAVKDLMGRTPKDEFYG